MKAVFWVKLGADAKIILNYIFRQVGRHGPAKGREAVPRVQGVFSDLKGDCFTNDSALDAGSLTYRGSHLEGREVRHWGLSIFPGKEDERSEAEELLKINFPKLAKLLAPNSKTIGVLHGDSTLPHAHAVTENYDPKTGRRLNWDPSLLKKIQKMDWSIGLETSKGHVRDPAVPISERGKKIEEFAAQKKKEKDQILDRLRDLIAKAGWRAIAKAHLTFKLFQGDKKTPLSRPSLTFEGQTFRRDTLEKEGFSDIARIIHSSSTQALVEKHAKIDAMAKHLPVPESIIIFTPRQTKNRKKEIPL